MNGADDGNNNERESIKMMYVTKAGKTENYQTRGVKVIKKNGSLTTNGTKSGKLLISSIRIAPVHSFTHQSKSRRHHDQRDNNDVKIL